MTYFDRRDLLNSKKLVWDGFHNLSDLPGPICDFSRFLRKSRAGRLILEKFEKNRKLIRGGRVSWGNHPKPIFWSLGGPCGQYESYTSLARPFSTKLCCSEVKTFLADFLEIAFWSMCGYVISREKKLHSKGNNFFVEVSSGKCLLGSYAWEILVFVEKTWFKKFLQHFEI